MLIILYYISFIYKLYKLILRNHDIILSIIFIKSHIVKSYEIILIDKKLHKLM
jgi:hypothetical protein